MSSYTPAVPSANGGTNAVSQDTFAAGGAAVSGSGGGGGGGSSNPNAQFSSITMAPNSGYISTSFITASGGAGFSAAVTLIASPAFAGSASQLVVFNTSGQDNVLAGQLSIGKGLWLDTNTSSIRGLSVSCYSTVYGSFQPLCCGDLYVNNSDGDGQGTGVLKYVDSASTLLLAAAGPGGVSISSLSVSSINGQVPGTGGGPAVPNAQFSSITMAPTTGYISTSYVTSSGLTASTMNISSINGINFAALVSTVNGLAGGGGGGSAPSIPSVPTISGVPSQTSMSLNFDSAGETGTPPITYSGLYGLSDPPTTPAFMANIGGTSYILFLSGLAPSTPYYARSVATNAAGTTQSLTAGPFTTAA